MSNHTKKIGLLGVSLGSPNMGVQALANGSLQALKALWPASEILLIDYGYKECTYRVRSDIEDFEINLINLRFSKKIFLKNNIAFLIVLAVFLRFFPGKGRTRALGDKNPYLKQILECSLFFAVSGGDSFSDIYGLPRLFYVSLPQILAILLKKRLILLPQTLGPFSSKLSRAVAGCIMKHADIIFSRDKEGLKEVQKDFPSLGKSGKLIFCPDLGFLMDPIAPTTIPPPFDKKSAERPIVGLNISGLLYRGGYSGKNEFGLKIDYKILVRKIIQTISGKYSLKLVLVPHVLGKTQQGESDWVACHKIFEEMAGNFPDRLFFLEKDYDQHELKYLIGRCDVFIGSRMHSCIAALSQKIPAVSIAYSKKFRGVYNSIDMEELVADPRQLSQDAIMKIILSVIEKRLEYSSQLNTIIPNLSAGIMSSLAILTEKYGQ